MLLALCLCDEACGFYSANSQIQFQMRGGGRGRPGEVIEEQLSKFLICEKKTRNEEETHEIQNAKWEGWDRRWGGMEKLGEISA